MLGLLAPLAAQQTWIVDRQGRPGTDFADLPDAVAAANPGDTLLVRAASIPYSAFATGKGLTVLGDGHPEINSFRFNPAVQVIGLPASQRFVMHGFRTPIEQAFEVVLQNDAGPVVLSDLRAIEPCNCGPGVVLPPGMTITDCAQVSVDGCDEFGKPAISCVRSDVTITRCNLGILPIGAGLGDCLLVDGGRVEVVESHLDGSWAMDINGVTQPAVRLLAGTLRLGATAETFVQGGTLGGNANLRPAIDAAGGVLELDPDVRLNPQRGGGIGLALHGASIALRQYAFALVPSAPVGGPLELRLHTSAFAPSLLLLGLPTAALPSPFGTFLLDPSASILVVSGAPSTGLLSSSLPLPLGLPRGLQVCVQGVADLGAGIEVSSPAVVVLD